MKVYVVTTGSYSDYRIDSIFSTKEKAEEYKDIYEKSYELDAGDVNDIEEYDLDDPEKCWALNNRGLSHYHITINIDFTIKSIEKYTIIQEKPDFPKIIETHRKEFEIQCYAIDMDGAIKIAADRLHQYLGSTPGWKLKEDK